MTDIRLDTVAGCRDELQRCANGIAQLISELTKALRHETETQIQFELAEAIATVITATEMKARVTVDLSKDTDGIRASKLLASASVTALNARMRALEKRLSAAQSALKAHETEDRAAGVSR